MKIHFEELYASDRAGGIDMVTEHLVKSLRAEGTRVTRSSVDDVGRRRDGHPDCVHIQGIWCPRLAHRLHSWRRQGIPYIASIRGMLEPWALANKPLKKRLAWAIYQKCLLNSAAVVHTTSERELRQCRRLGLIVPLVLIPWGVALPVNASEQRQDYARGPSGLHTALFLGRIDPVKGLPMLIEAWRRVRPQCWKMKVVGPDEAGHRAEVEALIRKAGLSAQFEFTGKLTGVEKQSALSEADLLVLPTHSENFGMVIGEALAHRLPVITTKEAPWEVLEEYGCGWWTEASVKGIAQALSAATRCSSRKLEEMGARGRHLIEKQYAWPPVAKRFLEIYQRAVMGDERPFGEEGRAWHSSSGAIR